MLGRKSGFQAHVKAVAPNATAFHCFIHRFALCAKVLPPKLLSCLNRVIRIVNFVKTSALNTRLFKLLYEDFGSDHICLLYHTEVRWLSRGNMTRRLFELRDVLLVFFKEKEHDFQKDLEDEEFISRLVYLSDIFGALNHLNLFQGPDCTVTEFISKLGVFVRKLDLWMKNMESERYGMFQLLTILERKPTDEFAQEIVHHLSLIKTELNKDEAQRMLSFKLLGDHGLLIPDASPSRCSPATDFPLDVGVRAGVLSLHGHQVKEPEPSCCAQA
ncbi:zinc finger MYM-type protein 6-like [Palaemon carinicauda]|uniref:zinc finger MYM-type protein 6-like n=1 Tax=Palaemon carinicauda TaxID=392227 RepID=UPI0035B5AF65